MAKVWFITGTSRGFGREWAEAALERGDSVAGTARNLETLEPLADRYGGAFLPLPLDVTDRSADFAAVQQAAERFGQLDIVINNAGYGQFGMIEELSEHEVRAQVETNLFGALWITQAALPIMRAQGFGHIIQVSSVGGVTAFPSGGAYNTSKWGLEGFSQALAQEVAGFGIHVTLIEPGGYTTDWAGQSAGYSAVNPAYAQVPRVRRDEPTSVQQGDPAATRDAIMKVVDADQPPLRIFFGCGPLAMVTADYESRLATWREWDPVSVAAQGE